MPQKRVYNDYGGGTRDYSDYTDKQGKRHQRIVGSSKEGYRDYKGDTVIYPKYEAESEKEYQEIVKGTRSGKPISEARNREIQANIDRRSKTIRMAGTSRRLRPKIEAHRAQRRKIIASRKAY